MASDSEHRNSPSQQAQGRKWPIVVLLLGVVTLALALTACGGGGENRMSIDAYVKEACQLTAMQAYDTWGDTAEAMPQLTRAFEQLSPPYELEEWHTAVMRVARAQGEFANNQGRDSPMDPGLLRTDDQVLEAYNGVLEATEALDDGSLAALMEHGCVG